MEVNTIHDSNGNRVYANTFDALDNYVLLTIHRADRTFATILLTPEDVSSLKRILDAVTICAGRGHDAVPERVGGRFRYHCQRCGAEWEEA